MNESLEARKACSKLAYLVSSNSDIAESERMDKIQELEKQVASLKEQLNEQLNKPVDHTSLSFDKMVEEVVKKHLHIEIDCSESGCITANNFWDDKELPGSSCWVSIC